MSAAIRNWFKIRGLGPLLPSTWIKVSEAALRDVRQFNLILYSCEQIATAAPAVDFDRSGQAGAQ